MPIGHFTAWLGVIGTMCRLVLAILNQYPLEQAQLLQGESVFVMIPKN
jgi:hypothetical protein